MYVCMYVCMYCERSDPRENGTREQAAKLRRADLLKIFISASPRGSSIPLADRTVK